MRRRHSKEKLVIGEYEEFQHQAFGGAAHGYEDKFRRGYFTCYTWSSPRQPRDIIEKESRRVREFVGAFFMASSYDYLMEAYNPSCKGLWKLDFKIAWSPA